MSKLEELINKLCPNGVEFQPLKNKGLFKFYYGKGNRIPEDIGGIYDVYGANGVVSHINEYNCEDVTIIGHIGAVGMVNRCKGKCFVTYNGTIAEVVDKLKVNSQYLYYVLTTLDLPSYKKGSQPFLSVSDFDKISIPVPPLEVQCEIVRILDNFTLLSAELSAELSARQRQYEYYKEILLEKKLSDKVRLGDCLLKVENIKWKQTNDTHLYIDLSSVDREKHRIINTTKINKSNAPSRAQQIVKTNDVLFGGTRPMLKRSCLIEKQYNNEICSTGFCVLRANTDKILPKWIYFMISTNSFYNYVEQNQKGASYPAITDGAIKDYEISLPSLKEQEKMVELLDKFEKYNNDMFEGLPAEIEARKKQYEYYRDKLLTFKELK
ncbi:restriction endonuclease subunit S [Campylobacter devanensis]|uniref:restriction endonuclease subunit S n=1 Tax=Campylobacter devanensis TaxID=3161138 RepID=UPI000A34EAD6|nr:restriction endonuclease subunit S [Campylobacter sp. P0111]